MPVWRYDLISNRESPGGHRRNLRRAAPAPGGEAGKAQARRVEGVSGFELSERLRLQGERCGWLMENGEVSESFPASRCTPWSWAGGDHDRSSDSGNAPLPPLGWQDILKKESRAES